MPSTSPSSRSYHPHPHQHSQATMPSYYYPSRQRTYSQSYYPSQAPQVVYSASHHNPLQYGSGYAQPGAYYASPQYYQQDFGRHHGSGHHRSGSGNVYYTSSSPGHHTSSHTHHSPSHHHHTSARRSTSAHTSHHPSRSQSVPRQSSRAPDYGSGTRLRRSESRPRETATYNVSHHRRNSSSNEPLGERIRRMFGFGGHSNYNYRDHRAEYRDRSGRTVDWRGRPIYRV